MDRDVEIADKTKVEEQNQEIHKDAEWQKQMIEMEMRVSDLDEYKDIAFLHHLIITKSE